MPSFFNLATLQDFLYWVYLIKKTNCNIAQNKKNYTLILFIIDKSRKILLTKPSEVYCYLILFFFSMKFLYSYCIGIISLALQLTAFLLRLKQYCKLYRLQSFGIHMLKTLCIIHNKTFEKIKKSRLYL